MYKKMEKKYSLVLSWWWARGFYTLGVLKWLEEKNIKPQIDNVRWVSIWAVIWSLRLSWLSASKIFEELNQLNFSYISDISLMSSSFRPIINTQKIRKILKKYLPSSFAELEKPFFIWCVDSYTSEYKVFNTWVLDILVLSSMSIVGMMPAIEYNNMRLFDGWLLNNFPIDLSKKQYPDLEIIWVDLINFTKMDNLDNIRNEFLNAFHIIIESQKQHNPKIEYIFNPKIDLSILSLSTDKRYEIYQQWYLDCISKF